MPFVTVICAEPLNESEITNHDPEYPVACVDGTSKQLIKQQFLNLTATTQPTDLLQTHSHSCTPDDAWLGGAQKLALHNLASGRDGIVPIWMEFVAL